MGKELESFWLRLQIWNCLLVYDVNAIRINRKLHVIIYWLNGPEEFETPPPTHTYTHTHLCKHANTQHTHFYIQNANHAL